MVLGIIIVIVIYYVIAEFLGRSKHIGRWWTFFLLLAGFFPGVIAVILSPSAKKKPTAGGGSYKFWGIVCVILGIIGLISFVGSEGTVGYTFAALILSGIYLLQLSSGRVINNNPKFYLDSTSKANSNRINKPTPNSIALKNDILDIDNVRTQLISLRNSKILTEAEYQEKINIFDSKAVEEEITNSVDYADLKSLTANGILSEEEFKLKVDQLREKYRKKKNNPPPFPFAECISNPEEITTPEPVQLDTPPPFKF